MVFYKNFKICTLIGIHFSKFVDFGSFGFSCQHELLSLCFASTLMIQRRLSQVNMDKKQLVHFMSEMGNVRHCLHKKPSIETWFPSRRTTVSISFKKPDTESLKEDEEEIVRTKR